MKIVIEENNYLQKFFKYNNRYSEKIKKEINNNILNIINQRNYKIKIVNKLKYKEKTIYEYKIVLDKNFTCRVAYIKNEDTIIVFYISTNIIKSNFTKEVSKLKEISK